MILTTHALTGAALGKYINSPWILLISSIALHFLLDNLRHGEYLDKNSTVRKTLVKVSIDLSFGLCIILAYIFSNKISTFSTQMILLGAFFSIFPDFLTFLHWKMKVPYIEKIYLFHQKMHRFPDFSPERRWGSRNAINDILLSLFATALLFL